MIDPPVPGKGIPIWSRLALERALSLLVNDASPLTRERLLETVEARCAELLDLEGAARVERNFLGACATDLRVGRDPKLVAAVIRTFLTRSK